MPQELWLIKHQKWSKCYYGILFWYSSRVYQLQANLIPPGESLLDSIRYLQRHCFNTWYICSHLKAFFLPFLPMSMHFDWVQAEVRRGRSLWRQKSEILSHGQAELWQYRVKWAGEDKAGRAARKLTIMGRKSRIHLLALRASDKHSPRLQSAWNFWWRSKLYRSPANSLFRIRIFTRSCFFECIWQG